ncbi:MAG: helix-turn-helix transcriptional regulator [Methanobacteriaceae archaeon]|jgi:AraC-like DNA-binding protein|nr:helix-turn-helix transcriptional regulator [Methanobacteriaceae archaeon]
MKDNPLRIELLRNSDKDSIKIINETEFKSIYKFDFKNSGKGQMISYEVFPGIHLINIDINGFNLDKIFRKTEDKEITINHCRKGRFECNFYGKYQYLHEGDLVASTKNTKGQYSGFPLGFYEGIEIFIDINIAKKYLNNILGYSFDLDELYNKICQNDNFLLFKASERIEHIFNELYYVDEKIQIMYYKLKILELFLFLKITPLNDIRGDIPHLSKKQVDTIKKIKKEIIKNINEPITLNDLSKKYKISNTSLKTSFKTIYGKPLFTWRKEYRLQEAKRLLKESGKKISQIASDVGYKNSSKFSAAFKEYYNITPREYRLKKK